MRTGRDREALARTPIRLVCRKVKPKSTVIPEVASEVVFERTSHGPATRRTPNPPRNRAVARPPNARPIQTANLAGQGSLRLGRFDSFAASLRVFPGVRVNLASPRVARARLRRGSTQANLGLVIPPAIPPSGLWAGWLRRRDREDSRAYVGSPVWLCPVPRARVVDVARWWRGSHPGPASRSGP